MANCCCNNAKSDKIAVSCLGRCDLRKHHCLDKDDIGPGHIPRNMGWLYTAKDSPHHQLRCGWRPGHISCPVLRRIEQHNCGRCGACSACCGTSPRPCLRPPCGASPCARPPCAQCSRGCLNRCGLSPCPSTTPSCGPSCTPCNPPPCEKPMIRIIRHNGQYSIITKPEDITNHPSGPFPLKYVLNTDDSPHGKDTKFTIEAKFNDYHFDYTSSQSSFVLDFSPPDTKCVIPCSKRSSVCFPCQRTPSTPVVEKRSPNSKLGRCTTYFYDDLNR